MQQLVRLRMSLAITKLAVKLVLLLLAQQGAGLLILIAQGLGRDHLRRGQPSARPAADVPKGRVRHPRHGGEEEAGGNRYFTYLHSLILTIHGMNNEY